MNDTDGIEYFTEENSAETVIARMAECPDPRLRQVMTSLVHHLHGFVKDIEPSQGEWTKAIEFLTRAGQMCDDKRQEWILLSDILGVSMLVDAINSRRPGGATENTVLGPFHVTGIPVRAMGDTISLIEGGEPLVVSGRITDTDGHPVDGATLDIWQSSHEGFYSNQQPELQPADNLRGGWHLLVPQYQADILPDPDRRAGGPVADRHEPASVPPGAYPLHHQRRWF